MMMIRFVLKKSLSLKVRDKGSCSDNGSAHGVGVGTKEFAGDRTKVIEMPNEIEGFGRVKADGIVSLYGDVFIEIERGRR